jgi:hypothetical protein
MVDSAVALKSPPAVVQLVLVLLWFQLAGPDLPVQLPVFSVHWLVILCTPILVAVVLDPPVLVITNLAEIIVLPAGIELKSKIISDLALELEPRPV